MREKKEVDGKHTKVVRLIDEAKGQLNGAQGMTYAVEREHASNVDGLFCL